MSAPNQTMLSRVSIAIAVFALAVAALAVSGDRGSASTDAAGPGAPVAVTLSEFKIAPATIAVPKGGSLAVTNGGTMAHNVSITGTAVKSADIAPGGSATVDLSSLSPGTYEIFCAVPGHKDSGMTASLVIGDGSAASVTTSADASGAGGHDMANMDMNEVGNLSPSDPMAKRINKQLEDSMSDGVKQFLANAKRYAAGEIKTGNAPLVPTVLADGTKRFNVTAAVTDWEVSPGKIVKAWTYNGIVPGPWIKVNPGDKVEVVLRNELPISTDIHFHGVSVPNNMDGLAPITQRYIEPLTSFTYKFTAPNHSELGMWHAHMHGQTAVLNGLFAVFQVGDVALPTGRTFNTMTVPDNVKISQEIPMVLNDAGVIGLSLNGKAFPETAPIVAKKGDYLLINFFNEGLVGHPMHLHRQSQLIVAKDGFALAEPYQADTIWVAPGERYSVLVHADEVGTWAFHCHILNHSESDAGLTGMVTALIVQ